MTADDVYGRALSNRHDADGFASMVGAVLATLLAFHLGFGKVILLAAMIYELASMVLRRFA